MCEQESALLVADEICTQLVEVDKTEKVPVETKHAGAEFQVWLWATRKDERCTATVRQPIPKGYVSCPRCTGSGMSVHRKQGLFFSVYVDDIKMAGKKQNMAPMWKKLMKNDDLDELASFLDLVYRSTGFRTILVVFWN